MTADKITAKSLKEWREQHGYTQLELAEALSVHRVTVAKWEAKMTDIPAFLSLALLGLEKKKKK